MRFIDTTPEHEGSDTTIDSPIEKLLYKNITLPDDGCRLCTNCTGKYSHFPTATCISNFTQVSFVDPFPINNTDNDIQKKWSLIAVNATVWGNFNCNNNTPQLLFQLQDQMIDIIQEKIGSGTCDCPNCAESIAIHSIALVSLDGWPDYNIGGTNNIQIWTFSGLACFSYIELSLLYVPDPPVIQSITPISGPTDGGTNVAIWGTGFMNDTYQKVTCRFGESDPVSSIYINPQLVHCPAPPGSGTVFVQFEVLEGERKYTLALNPPLQFNYYETPIIDYIFPTQGSQQGGTPVFVVGTGFFESGPLACSFGMNKVIGNYINETCISCASPQGYGPVKLEISENGQQYTNSNVDFIFTEPVTADDKLLDYLLLAVLGSSVLLAIIIGTAIVAMVQYRKRQQDDAPPPEIPSPKTPLLRDVFFQQTKEPDFSQEIVLGERIGRGTHGEVFKGIWHGTAVAVKKLPTANITPEFEADLQREAELMREMRHPNVLQFLAAQTIPPNICIVMEYMTRGSLFRILHDESIPLTWDLIKRILLDASRGMNYLHKSTPPILHRDFKSHNLLVDENWKAKVCDFGLSKIVDTPDYTTMTACGTPCWAAPEILRNQRYTEKADVYSFGMVMWECITREVPYQGMPPFQVVYAVGTQGIRPEIPDDTPPALVELINDCWAEEPTRRPSFDTIIQRLEIIDIPGFTIQKRKKNVVL